MAKPKKLYEVHAVNLRTERSTESKRLFPRSRLGTSSAKKGGSITGISGIQKIRSLAPLSSCLFSNHR